jgi:hypothetical protein
VSNGKQSTQRDDVERHDGIHRALLAISFMSTLGVITILIFSLGATSSKSFGSIFSTVAVGIVFAGSSMLSGGLVGLLFGIPKKLQLGDLMHAGGPEVYERSDLPNRALYGANTNLEQISDWLTKILVGVGLVETTKIGHWLDTIGTIAGNALADNPSIGEPFAIALIVYFAITGFLLGYLSAALYLGAALTAAESTYSLQRQITEFEEQARKDELAIRLTARQVSDDIDAEGRPPTPAELKKVIEKASKDTRSLIFYRAQFQRQTNNNSSKKQVMERTIPIFQALAACDDQNHAIFGQLGFALKDQRNPNWVEAEKMLSNAINLRGPTGTWQSYEFNRAECRISLDEAFLRDQPSAEPFKKEILNDFETANKDRDVASWENPTIKKWLKLNGC